MALEGSWETNMGSIRKLRGSFGLLKKVGKLCWALEGSWEAVLGSRRKLRVSAGL